MSDHAPHAEIALLGLGSNLGNREAALRDAVELLARQQGVEMLNVSSFVETDPVGEVDQPRFINGAAKIRTTLEPRALLDACMGIERRLGRDREHDRRWGPRTIDIDLLLYGSRVIDEPGLCVPHPRFHQRRFALEPAVEIAGELQHPRLNASISSLLQQF